MTPQSVRRPLHVGVVALALMATAVGQPWRLLAQAPAPAQGVKFAQISEADMKEYLTYLASDELQGRQVFTEGYGLAASYVAEHLRQWGVKPLGDNGTYFQTVKRRSYRVTNNSSVTVEANGQSRTFTHGDHVTFPPTAGGKQTLTFTGVEFVGYGMVDLGKRYDDFQNRDLKGKLAFWMSGTPDVLVNPQTGGGGRGNRSNFIRETYGPAAVFGFSPTPPPPTAEVLEAQAALARANEAVAAAQAQLAAARGGARGGRGGRGGGLGAGRGQAPAADLTTVYDVSATAPPLVTADETFYEFLFAGSPTPFAEIRRRAEAGEALAPASIDAKITVAVDVNYELLTTEMTKNVVGMVEGTDPALKSTYVMFGAHLDHVGYRTAPGGGRGGRGAAPSDGPPDLIFNGADDDGSGSVGLMGI
ncbi:MAG TPA: M28 family peptidase, partial [Vicinamibacterales bacterium]|nr:M28 family peptidase [Vicinamibacterales bacterium]